MDFNKQFLFTPHGLKIRLDPNAALAVIDPLIKCHDLEDILMDVELWENLPDGVAALAASLAAYFYRTPSSIIGSSILGYTIASFIRSFTYSDLIRRVFPTFITGVPLTVLHTLAVLIFLLSRGHYVLAGVLVAVNGAALAGVFNLWDLLLTPIRVTLRKFAGLEPTHQESVFVSICNLRAAKYGLVLDWDSYSKRGS